MVFSSVLFSDVVNQGIKNSKLASFRIDGQGSIPDGVGTFPSPACTHLF
jgi:hypothetical protein